MSTTVTELLARSHADWLGAAGQLTFETRPFVPPT